MSLRMSVDFSATDFILCSKLSSKHIWHHDSVSKAMKSIYPEVEIEPHKIEKLLQVVNDLATHCSARAEPFHNIGKNIKETVYHSVKGLGSVAKRFKLLLFLSDEYTTIYLYPRHLDEREKDVEYFKESRDALKLDLHLTNISKSRFKVVSQVVSKVLESSEKHGDAVREFYNEAKCLRQLQSNSSLVALYHYIQHLSRSKFGKNRYTKLRLFEEKYSMDFSKYIEFYRGKNEDVFGRFIKACFYLTWTLNNLHKNKLFHGAVKSENFLFRQVGMTTTVALRNLDFAAVLEDKKDTVACLGKPALLSGFESIRSMIESNTSHSSVQGMPSDVWALGCTLYHLIHSRYPDAALLISLSPKLNSMCHLLRKKVKELSKNGELTSSERSLIPESDRSSSSVSSVTPHQLLPSLIKHYSEEKSSPGSYSRLNLSSEEIIRSTSKSTEPSPETPAVNPERKGSLPRDKPFIIHPTETINSKPTDHESLMIRFGRIDRYRQEADVLLARIDSTLFGNLSDLSQSKLVNRLEYKIEKLNRGIQNELLGASVDIVFKVDHPDQKAFNYYDEVCNEIFKFNHRLLSKVNQAEIALRNKSKDRDPYMNLIKQMMHPDPAKRKTTQKALKFLKREYREVYKDLQENNFPKK